MNPLVIALIKKIPIIGDMISTFEGKAKEFSDRNKQYKANQSRREQRPRPRNPSTGGPRKKYTPNF